MPEPIQAPPAPSGQPSPAPNAQQQTPNQQPAQAAATPPEPSSAGTPPASPEPPAPNPQQLAQLQQSQLEAHRKITEQGQELARLRQQRDALAGVAPQNQPPPDPIAPYVAILVKKGYPEKDARDVAEVQWAMMQPMMQAQQQASAAIQGSAMVGQIMQSAWSETPQLFAPNAQIGQRVQQILQNDALAGRPIDKEYALNLAKIEWANNHFAQQNGQPPAAPAQQPPNFNGMWAPPAGYAQPTPPVQQKPQLPPEAQQWSEDIKKTFKTDARSA